MMPVSATAERAGSAQDWTHPRGIYTLFFTEMWERMRLGVIAVLFVASAVFWAGFEQVGSSFSLFAERFTLRQVGTWEMPAGWFQSVNPVFVIVLMRGIE